MEEEKKSSSKKVIIIVIVVILLIALIVFLILRSSPQEHDHSASIATIWLADKIGTDDNLLDWDNTPEYIARERIGFIQGKTAAAPSVNIREKTVSETAWNNDITSGLAEMINTEDILMVVGASEDLSTMYASMETDFFGIPMLIPFSDGDIVSDYSSGYTLRMTPNDQVYTEFIGKQLLPESTMEWINDTLFSGGSLPDDNIDVAVFFADNFNGHDVAVSVTQRLMDNGFDIDYYNTYPAGKIYSAFEEAWKNEMEAITDVDVVFIIGYDQDPMNDLSKVTDFWDDIRDPEDQPLFLLIAYAPTTADPDLFTKNNVFMIRQKLDLSNCPADIVDHDQAIAYAAGWITATAIDRASKRQPEEPQGWKLLLKTDDQKRQIHQDYLNSYRNNIRSVLMEMNDNVPCYGVPSFTLNVVDQTSVELVRYTAVNQVEVMDPSTVFNYIYRMYRGRYGLAGE